MPSNAIVIKVGKPVGVLSTNELSAQIVTTQNDDGTTSAVLSIECPINPAFFRIVSPTVSSVGTVNYPIDDGEVGVLTNTLVKTQANVTGKDTFNIKGVGGLPQLNLTMMLDEEKIDFGD